MKRIRQLAIFFFCILSMTILPALASATDSVWVGALREDGIIIPIGVLCQGKWKSTWPETIIEGPVMHENGNRLPNPLPLDKVPESWLSGSENVPENWHLVTNGPKVTLKASHALVYGSHCAGAWGLQTPFIGKERTSEYSGYKIMEGIVIGNSGNAGTPAGEIDLHAGEASKLKEFMRVKFNSAEEAAINSPDISSYNRHPKSMDERMDEGLKITTAFQLKTNHSKQSVYFLSLVRQYPRSANQTCYSLSVLNSWILSDGQQYKVLDSDMILTDCDGKEGSWITPLGHIMIEGIDYIISRDVGYEYEGYSIRILDEGTLKLLLHIPGGGC